MICKEARRTISLQMDCHTSVTQDRALATHLAQCKKCEAYAKDLHATRRLLVHLAVQSVEPLPVPAILEAVLSKGAPRPIPQFWSSVTSTARMVSAIAALVLFLLAGSVVLFTPAFAPRPKSVVENLEPLDHGPSPGEDFSTELVTLFIWSPPQGSISDGK